MRAPCERRAALLRNEKPQHGRPRELGQGLLHPAMPGAGRPKGSITIADRSLRLQMATEAARLYPEVIAFWAKVLRNEENQYSVDDQLEASDRIMAYGFGKPPQAIEANFQERKHEILEVRWMPPDPNPAS